MHTYMHTHIYTHARTHARTHTHTNTYEWRQVAELSAAVDASGERMAGEMQGLRDAQVRYYKIIIMWLCHY